VDWDQDGKQDILSGCYWTDGANGAHLQILKGLQPMDFAAAESLKNVAGKPLQNAQVDEASKDVDTDLICTHQHAVDYDGDGDLDLVMGCFGKKFFLYENIAEQHDGKNVIAEQTTTLPIESTEHHAAPHLVDWDKDGDLDLLSGTSSGGVILSENTGTRSEPIWSEFKQLVSPSNLYEQTPSDEQPIAMGPSTRAWATDWNGDGLLDLLIGDNTTIVSPASGVDEATWKKRRGEDDAEMARASAKMQEFMPEYQAAMEKGEQPSEDVQAKMNAVNEEIQAIYSRRKDYQQSKSTGHVWLLIRKADSGTTTEEKEEG
jgi:FG-GAP-like repeat